MNFSNSINLIAVLDKIPAIITIGMYLKEVQKDDCKITVKILASAPDILSLVPLLTFKPFRIKTPVAGKPSIKPEAILVKPRPKVFGEKMNDYQ